MKWTLRLINPEGEMVYSEAVDIHGNRRLCRKLQFAEQFDSLPAAEHGLSYFQLLWEFRAYVTDIIEIRADESFGVSDMLIHSAAGDTATC
jgi:hypothetical protein